MSPPNIDVNQVIRDAEQAFRDHAALKAAAAARFEHNMASIKQIADKARASLPPLSSAVRGPKLGGGTVAAIVAGVAIAGGTLYAMTRKKKEPVGPWTGRIDAEQASRINRGPNL